MNNQQMSAKDFHKRAERAREHGTFLESINFCELAFEIYAREANFDGMAEVCSSMFISLRHLSEKYDNISYLIRAKHVAEAGYEIAKKSNTKSISIPAFNLAQAHYAFEDFKNSIKLYKEAIKSLPDSSYNTPLYSLNMAVHLELANLKNGDKKSVEKVIQALEEMEALEEKSYEKDVWLSGGYMKLGEIIYKTDKKKSKEYLEKAKGIIDANPELTLRKSQLTKLESKLS